MGLVRIRFAATAAVAMLAAGNVAAAQADICTSLEAQLAALDRGADATSATSYRQYDASVARQQVEIDRATDEARRAGCTGGFLFFQPKPEPKCASLMATINRMQANLQRLSAERSRYSRDPYEISRQRSEILRGLAANQCGRGYNGTYAAYPAPQRPGNFLDMLFGQARIRSFDEGSYYRGGQFGTYRTLCVRTCDGYYFPISFSTVPSQFGADEQTCQSMCPGSPVALYTYRNPGEDTPQMVSLAGEPYTALPTAFRYRQQYDAACSCRNAATQALAAFAAKGALSPVPLAPQVALPQPLPRPAAGEDPETIANRSGSFVPHAVADAQNGSAVAGVPAGKAIRTVGPSYYYGQ